MGSTNHIDKFFAKLATSFEDCLNLLDNFEEELGRCMALVTEVLDGKGNSKESVNTKAVEEAPVTVARPKRKAFNDASIRINSQIQLTSTNQKSKLQNDQMEIEDKAIKTEMPPPIGRPKRACRKVHTKTNNLLPVLETIDLAESDVSDELKEEAIKQASKPVVVKMEQLSKLVLDKHLKCSNLDSNEEPKCEKKSRKRKAEDAGNVDETNVAILVDANVNSNATAVFHSTPIATGKVVLKNDDKRVMEKLEKSGTEVSKAKSKYLLNCIVEISPIKSKLAAFEKFAAEKENDQLPRVTRSKTRQDKEQSNESTVIKATSSDVLKTQAKFELQKQINKENDIKKEQLLQAQAEERKRKLEAEEHKRKLEAEEAEIKLRKQEAAEQQKMQALKERQKLREELIKKQEQQRKLEEKAVNQTYKCLVKVAEPNLQQQALLLQQKKPLQQQQQQLMKQEQKNNSPAYMQKEAPQLPTNDCYDSDDENYKKPVKCAWEQAANLTRILKAQRFLPALQDRLMSVKEPLLQDIFPNIHPKKLVRRSSAAWKSPARYTMIRSFSDDGNF